MTTKQIRLRGCGLPQQGAIYFHIEEDGHGGFFDSPVTNFLLDPVFPLPEGFGLSAIGMQLRPQTTNDGMPVIGSNGNQVWDLWDWIGSGSYPNPTDWILEIAELGFHQLIPSTLNFKLLSEESNYIGVHSHAYIDDPTGYYEHRKHDGSVKWPDCPFDNPDHQAGVVAGTCPGIFIQDILKGTKPNGLVVKREMPSFSYYGFEASPNDHHPAAFIKLPIGLIMDILVYEEEGTEKTRQNNSLDMLAALEASLQRISVVKWDEAQ